MRIATFNVENLIRRFDFDNRGRAFNERYEEREILLSDVDERDDYRTVKSAVILSKTDAMRQLTAQAIADIEADVVALQEIDEQKALQDFRDKYISQAVSRAGNKARYKYYRLIEGNDFRGIDNGLLTKDGFLPITRSHAHHTFDSLDLYDDPRLERMHINPSDRVFRRDCVEIDIDVNGSPLTLYNCHFKSQGGTKDRSDAIRFAEARAVRKIIEKRFGDDVETSNWVILGDLNESAHTGTNLDKNKVRVNMDTLELKPLLDGFAVNTIEALPAAERWTHYFPSQNKYSQLDYILLSPALAAANPNPKVEIVRAGLPYRAGGHSSMHDHETIFDRYPGVGIHRPKASDHCPMVVEIDVPSVGS